MARIEKFEDLLSWQKARELARMVYEALRQSRFAADFGLKDQMRRAAVSILSNISEGFERGGDKEFRQFLSQAKGSCGEVRGQLYVALDQSYISELQFEQMNSLAEEVSRLITGMITYLSKSDMGGHKFKQNVSDKRLRTQDIRL
jgi:four helix bundle protein